MKTVFVTATAKDNPDVSVTATVWIYPAAVSKITILGSDETALGKSLTLDVGDWAWLTAQCTPGNACPYVIWTSSDPKIAELWSDGTLVCNAKGKVTLTAAAADGSGKKATVQLTVR